MTKKFRVLTADDSAVVRRILKQVLGETDQIEVVAQARDGADAVAKFSNCKPDVVVMDIDMPVMDGLEATTCINALAPDVPIIMFSALSDSGTESSLAALSNGASDYVAKPSMSGNTDEAKSDIIAHLVPKILRWGKERRARNTAAPGVPAQNNSSQESVPTKTGRRSSGFEVVVVGVSTGGPDALKIFLREFPKDFNVPILIVQHMPAVFTKILAERLASICQIRVEEAKSEGILAAGSAVIAPGDYHMKVVRRGAEVATLLDQSNPVNFCRPAVDVLFHSAARIYGNSCLAVILTGMGSDGLSGSQAIHDQGGQVMSQNQASCAVWGMPRAVCDAGLVTHSLPPQDLARHIVQLGSRQQCLQNS